jgi:S1-C subfamily serine protease
MPERSLSLPGLVGLASLLFFACAATAPSGELERRIVDVAEKITPSVVHIAAIVKTGDRRNQVTGSGLIATPDGTVLTNEHVVRDAEKIEVSVPGLKRKYRARLVGADRQTDIAVLQIEPDAPLAAARLSDEEVRVGQWVVAIGNPYGLDGTVTLGIVSAKGRNLEIPELLNDFIQTDALIDRGSSGGPLVDLAGRVVGINSRGQGRGIGFTIPIATVREVMAQLAAGGIARGYLGVSIQALDRDLAEHLGIPDATGVLVNHVVADSPAAAAGLETGDVLTRFGIDPVDAEEEEDLGVFQRLVARVPPGTETRIGYLRDGRAETTGIVIGEQPKIEGEEFETAFGFHVKEITDGIARAHRLLSRRGAFVTFVADGSPAREAGLRVGDVIVRVEDRDVESVEDLRGAVASIDATSRFLLRARRGDEERFVLVKPRKQLPDDGESDDPDAVARTP